MKKHNHIHNEIYKNIHHQVHDDMHHNINVMSKYKIQYSNEFNFNASFCLTSVILCTMLPQSMSHISFCGKTEKNVPALKPVL